jgi:hypothetical protein
MKLDPRVLARLRLGCLVAAGLAAVALVALPGRALAIEGQWFFTFRGYLIGVVACGVLAAAASWLAPDRPGAAAGLAAAEAFVGGYLLAEAGYALAGTGLTLPVPAGALARPVENLNSFALMRAWQIVVVEIGRAHV